MCGIVGAIGLRSPRQYVEKGFCIRLYHRNYPETDCLVDNIWYHNDSYPFGTLCIAATLSSSDLERLVRSTLILIFLFIR